MQGRGPWKQVIGEAKGCVVVNTQLLRLFFPPGTIACAIKTGDLGEGASLSRGLYPT